MKPTFVAGVNNGQHKYAYTHDKVGNRSLEYRVYAGRTGPIRLKAELRTGTAAI
jgi:hypothetical protein